MVGDYMDESGQFGRLTDSTYADEVVETIVDVMMVVKVSVAMDCYKLGLIAIKRQHASRFITGVIKVVIVVVAVGLMLKQEQAVDNILEAKSLSAAGVTSGGLTAHFAGA
jgi:hypothetical protein